MMRHHTGRLETGTMLATLGKIFVAGAVLAAVCLVSQRFLLPSPAHASQWKLIVEMLFTIVVGAGSFFGAAYLLRVAEVHDVVILVRRKLRL
jgi:hypothetical protein